MTNPAIDLGTIEGFNGATSMLSSSSNALAQLALLFGRPPEEWDIVEGSFNDVVFHTFVSKVAWNGALPQIQDSGGRRVATFKFPYVDGQTTDDLGREPEAFDLEIIFFGNNYIQGFLGLMTELQKPTPGDLIHPVRGPVTCRMQSYSATHASDMNKAVKLNLRLVEHNFDLASYGTIRIDKNFKSALGDLAKAFQFVNAMIQKVQALTNFVNSVVAVATGLIEDFQDILALATANINSVFNDSSNTDIPTITPVNLGGLLEVSTTGTTASQAVARVATNIATVTNDVFSIVTRVNDPLLQIPVDQLSASTAIALAAQTVQKQVNDARDAAEAAIAYLSSIAPNTSNVDTSVQTVDGSIVFYEEIMQIKRIVVALQAAFELGLQQNNARIIEYTTPRIMSIREVAFENNISLDKTTDIDILNPELLSVNCIPKNTVLKVPSA